MGWISHIYEAEYYFQEGTSLVKNAFRLKSWRGGKQMRINRDWLINLLLLRFHRRSYKNQSSGQSKTTSGTGSFQQTRHKNYSSVTAIGTRWSTRITTLNHKMKRWLSLPSTSHVCGALLTIWHSPLVLWREMEKIFPLWRHFQHQELGKAIFIRTKGMWLTSWMLCSNSTLLSTLPFYNLELRYLCFSVYNNLILVVYCK